MDIRPSNSEIARFLLQFEKDGISKKSADLMMKENVPYASDPDNRVLLEWIEDHPFAWSVVMLIAGWLGGVVSKFADKFLPFSF